MSNRIIVRIFLKNWWGIGMCSSFAPLDASLDLGRALGRSDDRLKFGQQLRPVRRGVRRVRVGVHVAALCEPRPVNPSEILETMDHAFLLFHFLRQSGGDSLFLFDDHLAGKNFSIQSDDRHLFFKKVGAEEFLRSSAPESCCSYSCCCAPRAAELRR